MNGMPEPSTLLPPSLVGLLDVLVSRPAADPEFIRRAQALRDHLLPAFDESRPFLTVLLRTQGKRMEPFMDALLCLQAQTVQDFEVIVLEHDAAPEASTAVRAAVDDLPEEFRDRVRVVEVVGGTRANPLNAGLEAAEGNYVAVYDDDDLLLGDWVERFQEQGRRNPGRLLRAVVANQQVARERWTGARDGFRTLSWPAPEWPQTFDILQHLLVNYSPFMSWAFPRDLFARYGLRFDEELEVCEDWDLILRAALLCGVDEVPALTSIYRRWTDSESSYTAHSAEAWREAEQRVIDRIDERVYLMPPGSMRMSRGMVLYNTALDNYRFLFSGTALRPPLNAVWRVARPGLRFAVRVRDALRRWRGRGWRRS